MNISKIKEVLPVLFEAKITPLLIGHKGLGKTEVVRQFAKENGYDIVEIKLGNLQDPADLLGIMDFITDKNGVKRSIYARPMFWPTDPDAKVIIFFDELNRCNKQLIQPVMEIALEFKHHDYVMPNNCRVVAAMNPYTDDYQVNDLSDAALLDRFCQLKVTGDPQELANYLSIKGAPVEVTSFALERYQLINPVMTEFELDVHNSGRKFDMFISKVLPQNPSKEVLLSIGSGWMGVEATSALLNHLDKSPKPLAGKDLLNNYRKTGHILQEYANESMRMDLVTASLNNLIKVLSELEEYPNSKQLGNIEELCMDLPPELTVMFLHNLISIKNKSVIVEQLENEIGEWSDLHSKIESFNKRTKTNAVNK